MALDRNTPEGVEAWLTALSAKPWSFPTTLGPELSQEMLKTIRDHWDTYTPNIKLGVLFSILNIRKLLANTMKNELLAILEKGTREDEDEWVVLISKMLREYPSTSALDLNIEQHIPTAAQNGLQNLMNKIRLNGIKFYPVEYAFIDRNICDSFSTLSLSTYATPSHFGLRDSTANTANQTRTTILNNMSVPPSPSLTSPVNATGFNFPQIGQSQNQALHGPPSRSNSTSSGIFIPGKRRPSQLTQPYPKGKNPPKPGPINTTRAGSLPGAGLASSSSESPAEQKVTITQGKKYQKPSRIQMLDISTGTKIIKDQEESKRLTQLEEQQSKEARRLEREKKQEERRREEEEKRQQKEQEKAERAERQRLKEEAKRRKNEKTEKKTTKVASETESTDAQGNNYPGARKKKRLNSTKSNFYDVLSKIVEEETISDEEMSHKSPQTQTIVASPTSLSPPMNQFYDHNIGDNGDNSTTSNGFVPETSTIAEPLGQPATSDFTSS
ncbi:1271_t:CDS:2, partial [Scutellospora calospora]